MRFGLGEIKISRYRSDYRFHKLIQRAKAVVALGRKSQAVMRIPAALLAWCLRCGWQ